MTYNPNYSLNSAARISATSHILSIFLAIFSLNTAVFPLSDGSFIALFLRLHM